MNISTLCDIINLQPNIKVRVIEFSNSFDFTTVDEHLKSFQNYERMSEALAELQAILDEDPNNIKILSCMLKASADVYEIYKYKSISDEIYFDTMKCYTRFIDETYQMTGRLYFDRYWWTTRQAGCHLFRIGELEFEMKHINGDIVIGIHIPSDVDFSPSAIEDSLAKEKQFFSKYYAEPSNAEYQCHSWFLDKQLRGMLIISSNILSFQDRFEIFDKGEVGTDFMVWLYKTKSTDYAMLPENTSLQKNMKIHLLSGGVIRNAYGRLKG